jgi:hypothetical protein
MCCHTPDRNFPKEFDRKNCKYTNPTNFGCFSLLAPWIPFIPEATRARSNLVEQKMQTGNFTRNQRKQTIKIGLEIKILYFGCWSHFDLQISWKRQEPYKYSFVYFRSTEIKLFFREPTNEHSYHSNWPNGFREED